MAILSWLPQNLNELLKQVPGLLFEVVSWKALAKDIAILSKRMITGVGVTEARQGLEGHLPVGLSFQEKLTDFPSHTRHQLGELILELYFIEVAHPGPIFLDLRTNHFGDADNQWGWKTGNLWSEFSSAFREGMKKIYQGFYNADDAIFKQGLIETGLLHPQWPEQDQSHMIDLFKEHFGAQGAQAFKLSDFQRSFQKVFSFLVEKKVNLSTDLMTLGVLLVTLYMSLEELGGTYDVKKVYQKTAT